MSAPDPGFRLASELSARQRPPSLAVAVVAQGKTVRSGGFGLADIETRRPASAETVYLWFSMTKLVTATAVVQLAARGALGLDDAIGGYIPEFSFGRARSARDRSPPA